MRKLIPAVLLLAAGGLFAQGQSARAADNGFYLGAGVSQSRIDGIGEGFGADDLDDFRLRDTAWKIIAGFRPLDFFAVEVNYMDLGNERATIADAFDIEAEATAWSGYAVGLIPLPFVDLFAKGGVAYWEAEAGVRGVEDLTLRETGATFAWALGAQVRFGSLAARLEYEQFDIDDTDGLELLSLGLTYTFL